MSTPWDLQLGARGNYPEWHGPGLPASCVPAWDPRADLLFLSRASSAHLAIHDSNTTPALLSSGLQPGTDQRPA